MLGPELPADAPPGLHLVAVATPPTRNRELARRLVRQALSNRLAHLLCFEAESIALISTPGRAICLAPPWAHIGLSISHEPGLSLAVIHLGGPVGIDLMQIDRSLDAIETLAHDYLGPAETQHISSQVAENRPQAFAEAWTRLEARLKCQALPLSEWSPALDTRLATCTVTRLAMPGGWVAAVAT